MNAERKLTLSDFIERLDKFQSEHDDNDLFDFSKINKVELADYIENNLTDGESDLIEIWFMANILEFKCINQKNQQIAEKAIIKGINACWKYIAEKCKTENYEKLRKEYFE